MAYFFRLPVITDLTIEQQAVLNEPRAIAVSGGPGTGKSVVSLWRHIQNHSMGRRNSLLLTYTVSLESYLRSSAQSENTGAGANVDRTYRWTSDNPPDHFDEIIIDEAQDVNQHKYQQINGLTDMVSYTADDNQILYPDRATTEEQLRNLFNNANFTLRANYRNSIELVRFIRSLYPESVISAGQQSGPKPQVICSDGVNDNQTQIIKDVIDIFEGDTHNIAVLVPLESHVHYWHQELVESGYTASKYVNTEEEMSVIQNIHVTTYKSCKGLEFDTVIIPNFNKFEAFVEILDVVEKNDFYVVLTRSRSNLILIDHQKTVNGNCCVPFLQNQINNNIVEVDLSFVGIE
ncbi:3'-5' exonuclease [Lacinutrix jangbogonensis]|uniref:3'-5' exonuclease n=1 Tax=Lacinutrix jangbogonensis TaxID=1469557 RepID=UPI00053E15B9|nr:3'-5' exonuclease [Lacinutrix jangbogonensis]